MVGRVSQAGQAVAAFFVEGTAFENEDGSFQLSLPPGSHEITVVGAFAPRTVAVAVRAGQTSDVGEIAVRRGAAIEGVAMNAEGTPAVNLEVLTSAGGEERSAVDLDGRFRFSDLAPGQYQLTGAAAKGFLRPVSFDLQEGQTLPVRLQAEDAGRLAGGVVDSAGLPVRFARVEIRSSDAVVLGTLCDRRGEFFFEGLSPGLYQVVATGPSGVSSERAVDVRGRAETRADLQLPTRVSTEVDLADGEM